MRTPIGGEKAQQIMVDIGTQTPPEKSSLAYGPDELAFRESAEKEWNEFRKQHPNAILEAKE